MNAQNAAAQRLNTFHGVFAASDEVTAIDAGPDARTAALERINNVLQLIVERAGAVIVNRKAHVVFGDQLLQTRECLGIRLRVGRDKANAKLLRKLEDALVSGVIPGKTVD